MERPPWVLPGLLVEAGADSPAQTESSIARTAGSTSSSGTPPKDTASATLLALTMNTPPHCTAADDSTERHPVALNG